MEVQKPATPVVGDAVPRPNVLALVAPTTIRFLVLIGALLSAGLFVGNWLHNESPAGDTWLRRITECRGGLGSAAGADWWTQVRAEQRCRASVEALRLAFAVGGAGATLLAGLVVAVAAPRVLERRRRLRPADARWAPAIEKFRSLARDAGLRSPPALMVGSATSRDGFSYGLPRRYRVAVPPAVLLRWRDAAIFDPLIRHELAHLRHHDVPLAWLARSVWLVVLPPLTLPLLWGILSGDASLIPFYLWRAVLLVAVTLLAANALLRSREHDADLRAASTPESAAALKGLLRRVTTRSPRWRRLLAYHPSAADRLAVVERPERHAVVTFGDGLTAAFLAGLTLPLVVGVTSIVSGDLAFALSAILLGPLLGAAVGLGLWRQSLVARLTGRRFRVLPAALGVLVGSALGGAVSLAQASAETIGGYDHLAVQAVIPLALCGATLVAAGLGELFADAAPRLRRPRLGWIICFLVVGTVFGVALWAALTLSLALDQGGWLLTSLALLTVLSTPAPALTAVGLAVVSGLALLLARRDTLAPPWLVLGEARPSWPPPARLRGGVVACGAAAGAVGAAVIVGFRVVVGAAETDAEKVARAEMNIWVMVAAGMAAAVSVVLLHAARGLGVALVASPVASAVAAAGFLGLNTALGGDLRWAFVASVLRPGLALGLLGTLLVAPGLLALAGRRDRSVGGAATSLVAALLAGLLCLGVVAGRTVLVPASPSPELAAPVAVPRPLYGQVVARPLLDGRAATAAALNALQAEKPPNNVAADRIRSEILPVLTQMRDGAESVQLDDPVVQAVHSHAVAGSRLHVAGFTLIATALEANNPALLEEGNAMLANGNEEWERWAAGAQNL